jgi:serine/threonine-protein kinase RsbW
MFPVDDWNHSCLSTLGAIIPCVAEVTEAMAALGYSPEDVFGVRLALEEALVNAVRHGNRNDPAKRVEVRHSVTRDRVLLEVEDQGRGFDPLRVPDPTAPGNLERPGGRGLLLIHAYTSWVRYSERGNAITLCKYPSTPQF